MTKNFGKRCAERSAYFETCARLYPSKRYVKALQRGQLIFLKVIPSRDKKLKLIFIANLIFDSFQNLSPRKEVRKLYHRVQLIFFQEFILNDSGVFDFSSKLIFLRIIIAGEQKLKYQILKYKSFFWHTKSLYPPKGLCESRTQWGTFVSLSILLLSRNGV